MEAEQALHKLIKLVEELEHSGSLPEGVTVIIAPDDCTITKDGVWDSQMPRRWERVRPIGRGLPVWASDANKVPWRE